MDCAAAAVGGCYDAEAVHLTMGWLIGERGSVMRDGFKAGLGVRDGGET